jgi:hypothetical protein
VNMAQLRVFHLLPEPAGMRQRPQTATDWPHPGQLAFFQHHQGFMERAFSGMKSARGQTPRNRQAQFQ